MNTQELISSIAAKNPGKTLPEVTGFVATMAALQVAFEAASHGGDFGAAVAQTMEDTQMRFTHGATLRELTEREQEQAEMAYVEKLRVWQEAGAKAAITRRTSAKWPSKA